MSVAFGGDRRELNPKAEEGDKRRRLTSPSGIHKGFLRGSNLQEVLDSRFVFREANFIDARSKGSIYRGAIHVSS